MANLCPDCGTPLGAGGVCPNCGAQVPLRPEPADFQEPDDFRFEAPDAPEEPSAYRPAPPEPHLSPEYAYPAPGDAAKPKEQAQPPAKQGGGALSRRNKVLLTVAGLLLAVVIALTVLYFIVPSPDAQPGPTEVPTTAFDPDAMPPISAAPTEYPSTEPVTEPTTAAPTTEPTTEPTTVPTTVPTTEATTVPTTDPTTAAPIADPTAFLMEQLETNLIAKYGRSRYLNEALDSLQPGGSADLTADLPADAYGLVAATVTDLDGDDAPELLTVRLSKAASGVTATVELHTAQRGSLRTQQVCAIRCFEHSSSYFTLALSAASGRQYLLASVFSDAADARQKEASPTAVYTLYELKNGRLSAAHTLETSVSGGKSTARLDGGALLSENALRPYDAKKATDGQRAFFEYFNTQVRNAFAPYGVATDTENYALVPFPAGGRRIAECGAQTDPDQKETRILIVDYTDFLSAH